PEAWSSLLANGVEARLRPTNLALFEDQRLDVGFASGGVDLGYRTDQALQATCRPEWAVDVGSHPRAEAPRLTYVERRLCVVAEHVHAGLVGQRSRRGAAAQRSGR